MTKEKHKEDGAKNMSCIVESGKEPVYRNPFIASIDEFLSTENITERLATSPLDGIDVSAIGEQARMDILDRLQEEFFEPISTSLDIATRIYRLIRKGYLNRDPTKLSVRKMTMELAENSGRDLKALPWFSTYAKGMTITGITGLGKSFEVNRALQLLPQCVEHGRSQIAGWASMRQVTYLYVAMSHDGSLGGLLMQILCALDEVIGTQYSQDKAFTKSSNEKLAVRLGIIFRNHGVGVLVIDEIQRRNFEGHGRGDLAATFFLRLLNFGIPVVLIGNTLGMSALYSFSQDVRRIGSGGTIHLHPLQKEEFDWTNCLAPALWRQSVMSEPSSIKNSGELLFRYSGGIRDYACRILIAAQRLALDLGNRFVTEDHMMQAFLGSDFSDKDRGIIAGFREKNPLLLSHYEDMPWEEYAVRWGLYSDNKLAFAMPQSTNMSVERSGKKVAPKNEFSKPVSQKDLEVIKRKRTREVNMTNKRSNTRNLLGSADMRLDGLQEFLINGFDSLLSEPS